MSNRFLKERDSGTLLKRLTNGGKAIKKPSGGGVKRPAAFLDDFGEARCITPERVVLPAGEPFAHEGELRVLLASGIGSGLDGGRAPLSIRLAKMVSRLVER